MSGPYGNQLYYNQFLHAPAAERVYPPTPPPVPALGSEYDSVLGEIMGHSSSGCSSYLDSPTSNTTTTTYGAQSPNIIHQQSLTNTNFEAYYSIESENSHATSQVISFQECK